ncbi:MAG TPA: M1 family aminopeptidase [Pyrinomonadaceae bacterium]|nr:M1 family aminopeptidase [Pyrinomonadaceae bacterium]
MTRHARACFGALLLLLPCAANVRTQMRATEQNTRRQTPEAIAPQSGVPHELARRRAAHYRDISYALDVSLEPGAQMLKGKATIGVTLDLSAGDLVLDWRVVDKPSEARARVRNIEANGAQVADAVFADEHIHIPRTHLRAGANRLTLEFESPVSAAGSAVTRYLDREDGAEYVYTLFVPSDASTFFPCFDQPDLKARFRLTLNTPSHWKAISNTAAEAVTTSGTSSLWRFRQTEPISTYVFAFAAGPFTEFADEASQQATRLFVRRSKAERARRELAEIFRINREGTRFFENYFDYKFPFTKYDLVVLPEFAYGGMEHAGATFLREESVLFPSDPTAADIAARAELILHELAHQWFGDLVTMRWFDDLWLKEGFATFMAYKAIEEVLPQLDAWKVFHLRTKPLAYLTDVTKGTTPIFQEIPNLSAAKSAYGNIVYRKAPSLLRQAEFYLGATEFQHAVRAFVKEHAFANAEWGDLVRAFERATGQRLTRWAESWVRRRGLPDIRISWQASTDGLRLTRFILEQRDALGEGTTWPMRMKILLASADGRPDEVLNVRINGGGARQVRQALGKRRPAFVFANYEDYAYGRFLLDAESRRYLIEHLGEVEDEFLRALLWGSLWESVREAELAPTDYINLVIRLAPRERDEVTLQTLLSRAQTAYTRYLSAAQQRAVAPRLEQTIYERMMKAETPGLSITYFRAYREIATTREALDRLVDVLEGRLKVPGMTLRPRDRFDLLRALVAAGDARSGALLARESEADKSDDARRYAYAARAARPDAASKRRYFDAYTRDTELPESWIEASFAPFNTPQQSALTLPYLEPALAELPRLKRTRKIFFVNGWLAAFIGGQCDEPASTVVKDFLQREASLDRDLRLKVLEASDGLERCVRIRRKFADGAAP